MNFAEAMASIERNAPEFTTEVAPVNMLEAKKKFLASSDVMVPDFVYDETTDYAAGKAQLAHLKDDFGREDFTATQMEVLTQYIERVQQMYDLLQAMRDYRQARASLKALEREAQASDTPELEAQTRRLSELEARICELDKTLHGEPEEPIYRALLAERVTQMKENLSKLPADDREIYREMLLREPWYDADQIQLDTGTLFTPSPELVQRFKDFCLKRWAKIFNRVDLTKTYTPEEVRDLLNTVLWADFPYSTRWEAVIMENKTSLNSNQLTRQIELPRERGKGPYTGKVVMGIILGHELMVHVDRREYAEAHYPDLAVPLPEYINFEEGLAKAVEQVLTGEIERSGVDHYLTLGLIRFDLMGFRNAFDVQRRLLFYRDVAAGDTKEVREQKLRKAENEAFRLTVRCLRGTDHIPLSSNLVYFNGQVTAWRVIESMVDEPERMEEVLFRMGKSDPKNPLHQKLILSLGWDESYFKF